MAEVLITLGIIGIVAALTMPALIANHKKQTVETKLAKFYSVMGQAIKMSEFENEDKKYWIQDENNIPVDSDGNPIPGASFVEKWVNLYIAPYIKIVDTKYDSRGLPIFYLADGLIFKPDQPTAMYDWVFYTTDPEKCVALSGSEYKAYGRCAFRFAYRPSTDDPNWSHHYNKGFEPYKYQWDGQISTLKSGVGGRFGCKSNCTSQYCNWYCAALIQANGWKIPKGYPLSVF